MAREYKKYLNDPEGTRLPIKIDSTSNGEFVPRPLSPALQKANRLALENCDTNARKTGLRRREFLVSAAGAATTLKALNEANAAEDKRGSTYVLPWEAEFEEPAAKDALDGDEFIFDVQGHHLGDLESWVEGSPVYPARNNFKLLSPQTGCSYGNSDPEIGHIPCLTGEAYVKEVFLDSDTDIAVLSFFPGPGNAMIPKYSEAAETMRIVEALGTTQRLMIHGRCMPTFQEDLDSMDETAATWPIAAWKTYTQYGPNDTGFWLDDDVGQMFIDRARKTGVNRIAVHKGIPFKNFRHNRKYAYARDLGPAARQNPDMKLMVYHSGYDLDLPEGPYSRTSGTGVDSLITSLMGSGFSPEKPGNVYAELGSTWRYVMRDADQAAHIIGKLLKYVGEDRILWGTDSIWYGSPQDQIMAFRAFQISDEFQDRYGYPKLTDDIRAKIFGLNGADVYGISPDTVRQYTENDSVQKVKEEYAELPDPSYLTYGPKNRREFMRFLAVENR